jgi:hypothetical protein
MRRAAIPICALMALAATSVRADEITSMGFGVTSCGAYAHDFKERGKMAQEMYFIWAQGYLSGFNSSGLYREGRSRNLSAITPDQQQTRIDIFCDAHPLLLYLTAVEELLQSLPENPVHPPAR